ncbi:hypothetical protein DC3_23230 [Deinococcus cellulosilyticus NBRC 106333 = KACC 11606]|uniref:Uncharacterized protein n=1 Tax=Deinococcus cellulosilyticus (strain DSM 18568 / NBRC 106333 / KACC 11606 / 5516J-15) TaxID=1223518 RepID=A0A511N2J5_DEIC1|nr:hypothetical protein DC3_23230 [Deinococcus cellulosilyticus NBRC 106333 = KACC 11606]
MLQGLHQVMLVPDVHGGGEAAFAAISHGELFEGVGWEGHTGVLLEFLPALSRHRHLEAFQQVVDGDVVVFHLKQGQVRVHGCLNVIVPQHLRGRV